MKRLCKTLAFVGGALGATALVNRHIFKNADILPRSRFFSQFYKWRHGRIHYLEAGKAEPILLIHGTNPGESLLEWEEQIALLSKNYHVYAIDLLGFGSSEKPQISYSAYLYASLINDFVRDVICSPVNVVVTSGSTPYAIAACALNPELYNKFLFISPEGVCDDLCVSKSRLVLRSLMDLPILGTAVYNVLSSRLCIRRYLKSHGAKTDYLSVYRRYYAAHVGGVGNKYPISSSFANLLNVRHGLMGNFVDVPVHVVWGAKNSANPLSNFGALRGNNESIGLTVFENSGLMPHKDQPKKFYRTCRNFFG